MPKKIPSGLRLGWLCHPTKVLADEIKIGSLNEFYFEINVEVQLRFDLSNSLKTIVAFYTSLGMLTTNEISAAWAFHCCLFVFLSTTLNTPASLSFSLMAHLNARCTCRACVTKKRHCKKTCLRWCRNEFFEIWAWSNWYSTFMRNSNRKASVLACDVEAFNCCIMTAALTKLT